MKKTLSVLHSFATGYSSVVGFGFGLVFEEFTDEMDLVKSLTCEICILWFLMICQ